MKVIFGSLFVYEYPDIKNNRFQKSLLISVEREYMNIQIPSPIIELYSNIPENWTS